jgi:hypothetical protein
VEVTFNDTETMQSASRNDFEGQIRQLLVRCTNEDVKFVAGTFVQSGTTNLLWFGATQLAVQLEREIRELPGPGSLVLRVLPETGIAQLFRRGKEGATRLLVAPMAQR